MLIVPLNGLCESKWNHNRVIVRVLKLQKQYQFRLHQMGFRQHQMIRLLALFMAISLNKKRFKWTWDTENMLTSCKMLQFRWNHRNEFSVNGFCVSSLWHIQYSALDKVSIVIFSHFNPKNSTISQIWSICWNGLKSSRCIIRHMFAWHRHWYVILFSARNIQILLPVVTNELFYFEMALVWYRLHEMAIAKQ